MLLIDCPWCGLRDEHEYRCGGEAHLRRPEPAERVDDGEWGAYLFARNNPRGPHMERWVHRHGCGRWFNMVRDTRTHTILAIYPMGEPAPDGAGSGSSS